MGNYPKFYNTSKICNFSKDEKSLTFQTEKIHPKFKKNKLIPIMMLFSNPHPLSVQTGLFLSDPRSRLFWKRLFQCSAMNPSENLMNAISNWKNDPPKILIEFLLNGGYSDKFILFFDCLEELPTNQYSDLKKLFSGEIGRNLRKQVLQNPGLGNLVQISKRHQIKSWIVFSAEAYRYIVGKKNIAKYAPKRICNSINTYISKKDINEYWKSLKDLKCKISLNNYEITVYLSLIARCKNWKTQNGQRYFTITKFIAMY